MTSLAHCISLFSTVSTPLPAASGLAATRMASSRLRSASVPQRRGRPHGPGDHHRLGRLDREVQEVGRLLQGGRAVGDHHAGDVALFAQHPAYPPGEAQPFRGADGRAAHADQVFPLHLRNGGGLGYAVQRFPDAQVLPQLRVQYVVHAVGSNPGDAAPGGYDSHFRSKRGHGGLPPNDKSDG